MGQPIRYWQDGDRDTVIQKYKDYLDNSPELLKALPTLKGKNLVCWCSPHACHGDVLLDLANK